MKKKGRRRHGPGTRKHPASLLLLQLSSQTLPRRSRPAASARSPRGPGGGPEGGRDRGERWPL